MGAARGIDVSVYQKPQDWASLKDSDGLAFAFAKASEGTHTRDSRFATHIKGIKAAGLVPGAYHFGWPTQPVADEVANYVAAVRSYVSGPGFVHWLDLERRNDGANYGDRTAAQIKSWAAQWIALVKKAFPGQRVGVYTSGSDIKAGHVPDGVPLWYPQYPFAGAPSYEQAAAAEWPAPSGTSPLFWQFTSTPLDRDVCRLSEAELRAWAAGADPTPTPTPAPEDDVPIRTSLSKSKPQALTWGQWTTVDWDGEAADPGHAHSGAHPGYVAPASSWADLTAHLRLSGLEPGDQIQVRYEVHDWKDGKASGAPWTEIAVDLPATPGAQFVTASTSKGLTKGQHVYVAVAPFPGPDREAAAAPVAVSGRWTVAQDKES
jgi:GH25 family lysozyme M1 (1,4-beta-N-acetylmuramidase)